MTLPPSDNRRVTGLKDGQLKWLRKQVLNPVCAMPECSEPTEDGHHIWSRSLIGNDSWLVELETDAETVTVPHVTGLCRPHHRDVEEHRAWIKYEGGDFNWWRRDDELFTEAEPGTVWTFVGGLTPQPGEKPVQTAKFSATKTLQKKPKTEGKLRMVYGIRVPKDAAEQGHEVLDALVNEVREKYAPEMGWRDDVPRYYCVCLALVKALQ